MALPGTASRPPLRLRTPAEVAAWLSSSPPLSELRAAFPGEWAEVRSQTARLAADGDPARIGEALAAATRPRRATPGHAPSRQAVVSDTVRRYMLVEATRQAWLAEETGIGSGRVRFNLWNGFVLQRLLFESGLRRRPAPLRAYRLLAPALTQRRFLMPLVMPEGIYCFYTGALVKALSRLIGDRTCLEVAAGDGTLSRFLADAGVNILATDDQSWSDGVRFQDSVTRMDARTALRTHAPEVVVCSWPPPGNSFEKHVFSTPSVQTYILIGSTGETASGDWAGYRAQTSFTWARDARLSRMILPDEAGSAVYLFQRSAG